MTPREAYVLMIELIVSPLLWPFRQVRRWRLRRTLRKKMKLLGMIPLALIFAHPSRAQQAVSDSLIGTVMSRAVIPPNWQSGKLGIWCLTWIAERDDRPHVLVIVDAKPADPNADPLCPDGRGGYYPLWVDGPICPPGQVSPFTDRDFVIVRCGDQNISRYKRPAPTIRRAR